MTGIGARRACPVAGSSAAWLGAEQGEHAAVGVGEVGDDHAVLQRHWRDDDLAAQFLGLGGGRGDVCDLDDENGVRRDVAAGIEDATRRPVAPGVVMSVQAPSGANDQPKSGP